MNLVLLAASVYLPDVLRMRQIHRLFDLTADAFGVAAPDLTRRSFDEVLAMYGAFTSDQVNAFLARGEDMTPVCARLHQNALCLGGQLRRQLRIRSPHEASIALQLLYRQIGIQLTAELPGAIRVARCFFSQYYSPQVCEVVSSFDAGLVAGLCGGGVLSFTHRISEGASCCTAVFGLEPSTDRPPGQGDRA